MSGENPFRLIQAVASQWQQRQGSWEITDRTWTDSAQRDETRVGMTFVNL